jgi:uncharacterized DUF497 family protein
MDVFNLIAQCAGFQWDEGNLQKVLRRHHVSKEECEHVLLRHSFYAEVNETHSTTEPRYCVMGRTASRRYLYVTFTIRGDLIRVISARDMSRRERRIYFK